MTTEDKSTTILMPVTISTVADIEALRAENEWLRDGIAIIRAATTDAINDGCTDAAPVRHANWIAANLLAGKTQDVERGDASMTPEDETRLDTLRHQGIPARLAKLENQVAALRCGGAVLCCHCRRPVEEARKCYAIPFCYACLPLPEPLPVATTSCGAMDIRDAARIWDRWVGIESPSDFAHRIRISKADRREWITAYVGVLAAQERYRPFSDEEKQEAIDAIVMLTACAEWWHAISRTAGAPV